MLRTGPHPLDPTLAAFCGLIIPRTLLMNVQGFVVNNDKIENAVVEKATVFQYIIRNNSTHLTEFQPMQSLLAWEHDAYS